MKDNNSCKEHILLVDDENQIVQVEKQMLERLGYRVTAFLSVTKALKVFKDNPDGFDLVITDIGMPEMAGDQFAKEAVLVKQDIPIIICTGFSESVGMEETAFSGVKGILEKPFKLKDMSQMIRKVLDARHD